MPQSLINIIVYAGIILVSIIVIGVILTRLYRRATKDVALIRTGFGGEKVVLNGGIMVIPVLHELMQVRLTTVKLEVSRLNKDALITLDKLRVDVVGLFHIKVKPDGQSIAAAAQTLGDSVNSAAFGRRHYDDGAFARQSCRFHPEGTRSANDRFRYEWFSA